MIPHEERRFYDIAERLRSLITFKNQAIDDVYYTKCEKRKPYDFPEITEKFNGFWGGKADSYACFKFDFEVKKDRKNSFAALELNTGINGWDAVNPQLLLYLNGKLTHGFDVNHLTVKLSEGKYGAIVYAYTGAENASPMIFKASVTENDENIDRFYYKFLTACDINSRIDSETKERSVFCEIMKNTVNLLDFTNPYSENFYNSLNAAEEYFDENIKADKDMPRVWCVGHTHIDVAWLWTKAQTKEKVLRSFSTALDLLDNNPDYKFVSSQAVLYKYVKEQSPETYERIKKYVKEGRWEIEGSMWVESDCNLSSGESLIRQFLVGKRFFKNEFGKDTKVCWLPDTFGYSAAMPQILTKCGVETFITSKISWNEYNRMPHEIFEWQGVDGTKLLTYFLTTQEKVKDNKSFEFITYNGAGNAPEVMGTYYRLSDKYLTDDVLMPYGHGDGGGGTTQAMIQKMRAMSVGMKSSPRTVFATIGEFTEKLRENLRGKKIPEWVGELYLEFHRGTYTSVSKNKRNNRKGEFALWNTEWLSVLAEEYAGEIYPKDKLDKALELLLTNQFHDILPGSAIKGAYDESDAEYAEMFGILADISDKAMKKIAEKFGGKYLVFNPNTGNDGIVRINGKTGFVNDVPDKFFKSFDEIDFTNTIKCGDRSLENGFYILELDENGNIVRLYDKLNDREVVTGGKKFNVLRAYPDLPYEFDNWELKDYYAEKCEEINAVSIETVTDGARTGLLIKRKYLHSIITQTIWLYEKLDRIDIDTFADWNDHHIVLKAEFETDIVSPEATYEIQFGQVKRPTHANTSWEEAKFETCAQKFVDLSDYGYGISILNDCKYGHSIKGSTIGLTLLKCGTYPNDEADIGDMLVTYSIYPHAGDYRSANTIKYAYALNNPMIALETEEKNKKQINPLFSFDKRDIVCEVLKEAENGKGYIVRAYEAFGKTTKTKLKLETTIKGVYETDMLECVEKEIKFDGDGNTELTFAPYEIKTIYIEK